MAGGVGSRFWPMSTPECPKQFIDVMGCGRTFLQLTFDRFKGVIDPQNVWVVTSQAYADIVKNQLPEIPEENILLEPCRRNTAPCIAYVSWRIKKKDPKANLVITPSDHLVMNTDEFCRVIRAALDFTSQTDAIVTLGMHPTRPETGYGYIQADLAHASMRNREIYRVDTFREKPDLATAKKYVSRAEFFWNSGLFFWSADSILNALNLCAPEVNAVFEQGQEYFGTEREMEYINANFEACPSISIDFAVMEKADNVYVETVDFGWNDLGTWRSLYDHSPKNKDGNVTQNCKALMFNSHNNIVAVKGDKLVVASGLEGYIVADVDDALLIVPMEEEQKIKLYVNEVKSKFGDKFL